MKLALLVIAAFAFLLSGCATAYEDKAFFETGWFRPKENDYRLGDYHR